MALGFLWFYSFNHPQGVRQTCIEIFTSLLHSCVTWANYSTSLILPEMLSLRGFLVSLLWDFYTKHTGHWDTELNLSCHHHHHHHHHSVLISTTLWFFLALFNSLGMPTFFPWQIYNILNSRNSMFTLFHVLNIKGTIKTSEGLWSPEEETPQMNIEVVFCLKAQICECRCVLVFTRKREQAVGCAGL